MADISTIQNLVKKDNELGRLMVTLTGCGFGYTEKDLLQKTGLERPKLLEYISRLQRHEVIRVTCTQVGTSGPYDYFFRLTEGIGVDVVVSAK